MNTRKPDAIRVGVVGCGNVSRRYLHNVADDDSLSVVACADAVFSAAQAIAAEFDIAAMTTVDELLQRDDIDIVLNLTIPAAHASVTMAALRAGKHVYTEKPLAADIVDARAILALADERELQVGCAPDTFMGAGLVSCQRIIADGGIGVPISANAFMMTPGPELFHPQPDFLFQEGAGPLFDGGPYYISALVSLLGPISRVAATATVGRAQRQVLVGERAGQRFAVETPTHVVSLLNFARGAVGSMVTSFDVVESSTPRLEIHGTEGSLIAPAPNSWAGPVLVRRGGESSFSAVDIDDASAGFMGMGLVQMAKAVTQHRPVAASGSRGLHILEVLMGIRQSAANSQFYDIPAVSDDVAASFDRGNAL
ncbi:MAG: Gfo/Idh/MocA family protein [Rhodoglobus sp.]